MTYLSGLKNIYNFSLKDALENWNMQSFLFSGAEEQILAVTEGWPVNGVFGGSKIEQFGVFLLCHIWRTDGTYFTSRVEIFINSQKYRIIKKIGKVNLHGAKQFQLGFICAIKESYRNWDLLPVYCDVICNWSFHSVAALSKCSGNLQPARGSNLLLKLNSPLCKAFLCAFYN